MIDSLTLTLGNAKTDLEKKTVIEGFRDALLSRDKQIKSLSQDLKQRNDKLIRLREIMKKEFGF